MCTLAWDNSAGRLWVVFNRDEQRTRAPSTGVRWHPGTHAPFACATDPEGGGTWFAASTAGFAVALLNHHPAVHQPDPQSRRSRGLLVTDLVNARSPRDGLTRLKGMDLRAYAPFHLFFLSPEAVAGMTWDGSEVSIRLPGERFLTTSSHDPDGVARRREQVWRAALEGGPVDGSGAAALLRQREPQEPAYGLAMDREDARTVSQVHLEMDPAGFRFVLRMRDPRGDGFLAPQLLLHP